MCPFFFAHKNDCCKYTPVQGAYEIAGKLVNAKNLEVKVFTGGKEKSHPSKAKSYHGFFGIEEEVICYIFGFIKSN